MSGWARTILAAALAGLGLVLAWRLIRPELRARNRVESVLKGFLIACSTIAIFTTVGIVFSVLFESARFFQSVPITEFLFGLEWSPADRDPRRPGRLVRRIRRRAAIRRHAADRPHRDAGRGTDRPDDRDLSGRICAAAQFRSVAKPLLEILAGIPTVVYGFFAALVVAPEIRGLGESLGLSVASESALAAGLVMGIMIIPFVSSLSDDVINAVPQAMRDGALALGATKSETVKQVVFPAALPGIVGGLLLAVSRAIGETMIVVMAAGLAANLTANPLQAVTTVTVQIVTLLVGDQEFDSPKTLAAFALGLDPVSCLPLL